MNTEQLANSLSFSEKKEIVIESDIIGKLAELLISDISGDKGEEILTMLRSERELYLINWLDEIANNGNDEKELDDIQRAKDVQQTNKGY